MVFFEFLLLHKIIAIIVKTSLPFLNNTSLPCSESIDAGYLVWQIQKNERMEISYQSVRFN